MEDLDSTGWIVKYGFPDGQGCDYKFPYRDGHPDGFLSWTRQECKEYLEQPEKFTFLVVTAPVVEDDVVVHKPIALGVWDIATETKSTGGGKQVRWEKLSMSIWDTSYSTPKLRK